VNDQTNTLQRPDDFNSLGWPIGRLNEAVDILARHAGFVLKPIFRFDPPQNHDYPSLDRWFNAYTYRSGIESIAVHAKYAEIDDMILKCGPSILHIPFASDTYYYLVILKKGWTKVSIIKPDRTIIKIDPNLIKKYLCSSIEAPVQESINKFLEKANLSESQKNVAGKAMLFERLKNEIIGHCWLIRLSPGDNFIKWIRHLRIPNKIVAMVTSEIICQILIILSWMVIGNMIFQYQFDSGRFLLWGLLLLSYVPLKLYSQWNQCQLSLDMGATLKQRLLFGAMHLKQDETRNQGYGQFMSRIMESDSFESMGLDGGFEVILFCIKLLTSLYLLTISCGWELSVFLFAWMSCFLFCSYIYYQYTNDWISHFRVMTNNMIERMLGYRTRIVQENLKHWHDDEDTELNDYHTLSKKLDRINLILNPVMSRSWLIFSLLCLYLFPPESHQKMFIAIGGVLIVYQGFKNLFYGISTFIIFLCAWKQVKPLFQAASRYKNDIPEDFISDMRSSCPNTIVEIKNLSYRYLDDAAFSLTIPDLAIYKNDRILLQGPSGGGKSTLSSIISGMRAADNGIIFVHGKNSRLINPSMWRTRIVLSPQFHENYIFTGSLAFNLLMGKSWPPNQNDLDDAKQLCERIGLGDLLEKMPSGLDQILGESGWQLSHGEQSRVFIARAILQHPDLIIFDESFMPLDSNNFEKAMNCVLDNTSSIIVITHL
jgi:ATP-binding cassette subfamily B protein